jgi:hypothetical protein
VPTHAGDGAPGVLDAAEQSFIDLGTRVSALVGVNGYRALLARALHLAAADFPFLHAVRPASLPVGRLVGLREQGTAQPTQAEACSAAVAILAELLCLLEEFIGQELCQRITLEVWPWLATSDGRLPLASRMRTG